MLTFLIMAGGSGERFWPLSTREKPKQLLKIFSDKSLIRLAYERVLPLVPKENIFIATNSIQVPALKEDLIELNDENIKTLAEKTPEDYLMDSKDENDKIDVEKFLKSAN